MVVDGDDGVYALIGREVAELLADNATDLETLLAYEGAPVRAENASDQATAGQGSKDLVTILLGAAALGATLSPAIIRAINRLTSRPVLVKEMVLVPVEDSAGQVVTDADGRPQLHWMERARLLTADGDRSPRERSQVTVKALGFEISLGSSVDG